MNVEGRYYLVSMIQVKIRADDVGKKTVLLIRSCTIRGLVLNILLIESIVVSLLKDC